MDDYNGRFGCMHMLSISCSSTVGMLYNSEKLDLFQTAGKKFKLSPSEYQSGFRDGNWLLFGLNVLDLFSLSVQTAKIWLQHQHVTNQKLV